MCATWTAASMVAAWVVSRTLKSVGPNVTLVTEDLEAVVIV